MPFTIHKNTTDPFPLLVEQLRHGQLREHLVLVSTVQDKRLLQSELSVYLSGLTPKVEVLNHQLATWLKYGVEQPIEPIFLTPRERLFALEKWNAAHDLGLSESELDRMHDILSWISLHGVDPAQLPSHFGELNTQFVQFAKWCAHQNWIDRSLLYVSAHRVPSHALDQSHNHLYQIGKPDRHVTIALDAIMDGAGSDKKWDLYRPSGPVCFTGLKIDQADTQGDVYPHVVGVTIMPALNKRGEVSNAFKYVKSQVVDNSEGLAFDDFVVLVTDYETYRPIVEHVSDSFDVPISLVKGAKILGDPAVSRLRTLLRLGINGFQLEDVQDVYGDGIIPLSAIHGDETQLPNLRTFARFCKQYNIRTIDQLERELPRAIDREERNRIQAAKRRGSSVDFDPTLFKERHSTFYRDICDTLTLLKTRYSVDSQPLSSWLVWVKSTMELLGVLSSAELMTAVRRIIKAAEMGLSMVARIDYDPVMDGALFSKSFDALLDGNLPVTQHPGKVLVGALDDVTCLPGKHVIVLGMTESDFPQAYKSEDLFSFMGQEGSSWVRMLENDPYDIAVSALTSLATQARSLSLSYPKSGESDSMPSVFITDTEMFLPWWVIKDMVPANDNTCFDGMEWMEHNATLPWNPEQDTIACADVAYLSRHVSGVARLRESPSRVSIWDGMLPNVNANHYDLAESVIREAVTGLMQDGSLRISVSQLDTFAASPLEYFFKRLLRIEPPTEYIDEAEQNKKGTLLHTILDAFYGNANDFGEIVNPILHEDAARTRIKKIAEWVFDEHVEDLGNTETPFPGLLKNQLEATLSAFIDAEHEGLKQVKEIWGHVRPATIRDASRNVTEVPFLYELDVDGTVVEINGFIDRIDSNDDESIKIIYDYKSGSASSVKLFKQMNAGLSFQLPVYLNAMKGGEGSQILAGYYHIPLSKKGKDIRLRGMLGNRSVTVIKDGQIRNNDNQGLLPDAELSQFLERLQERRIKPIVRLILAGKFHQSMTEPSSYSDFKRMSRWSKAVNELRKLTISSAHHEEDIFMNYYVESTVFAGLSATEQLEGEE
jgi:hypothetical protein